MRNPEVSTRSKNWPFFFFFASLLGVDTMEKVRNDDLNLNLTWAYLQTIR